MNKKVIKAFASEIARQLAFAKTQDAVFYSTEFYVATKMMEMVVLVAKEFNPRFNEDLFRKACGL